MHAESTPAIVATRLTFHAEDRLRQRGIGREILALIVAHHDLAIPVGSGCVSLTVSRRALQGLLADGLLPVRFADKVCSVAVITEEATGLVVTVMHLHGRSARRYARPEREHHGSRARRSSPRRSSEGGGVGR
jgi:hypothetical protein